MRHLIPISGKDSLATAIVQAAREDRDYEYFYNPTGLELPEVESWLSSIESTLGISLHRVGRNLGDIIEKYGYFLPSQRARYCTRESKIEPMIQWLGKDPCTVYYGIRADENRQGFNNNTAPNIIAKYPLVEMNINLRGVYVLLNNKDLKPPTFFWASVHADVVKALGYDPASIMPEWMFDMLFSWRSRPNCDRCYNQRLYEWVGLLEHHPDRFWEAEKWEHLGSDGKYTWNKERSLKYVSENAAQIKRKRVLSIVKQVKKFEQLNLFTDETDEMDFLQSTSCGLFCGK